MIFFKPELLEKIFLKVGTQNYLKRTRLVHSKKRFGFFIFLLFFHELFRDIMWSVTMSQRPER